MPELSFAEVGEILKLIQGVEDADVTLEWGDLKVRVSRSGAPHPIHDPPGSAMESGSTQIAEADPSSAPVPFPEQTSPTGQAVSTGAPSTAVPTAVESSASEFPEHWVAITAPMVGTFYSAPNPGDPPFVNVGDPVASGQTVGLIEVMKLFTELTSEVEGKVARINVDNSTSVEYGQPLLWIEQS